MTDIYNPSNPNDIFPEDAPLSVYPEGITEMRVPASEAWWGNEMDALVTTHKAGTVGWQQVQWDEDSGSAIRAWLGTPPEWGAFWGPASTDYVLFKLGQHVDEYHTP